MSDAVSAHRTVAIVLGASAWPFSPALGEATAFANSSHAFRDYLLAPAGFAIPAKNVLDLFDSPKPPNDLMRAVSEFLTSRLREPLQPRDLIVYYVGHGGFTQ